ncbi:MAG: HNH endonuclease [Bdellovibrionaceae bacterium]|nr:HNH endonuclease [Pseudobdellovibrionaceae bacterium]
MESMIGRSIPSGCHVHHRNQKRDDNRVENLLLTQTGEVHMMIHRALDKGRLDLVEALERWCFLFMAKLRDGLSVEECLKVGDVSPVEKPYKTNLQSSKVMVRRRIG